MTVVMRLNWGVVLFVFVFCVGFPVPMYATPLTESVRVQKVLPSQGYQKGGFGNAVDLDGGRSLIGSVKAGRAYMFVRSSSGTWSEEATLQPAPQAGYAGFGNAVSLEGDRALVGAHWWDNPDAYPPHRLEARGENSGAAYIFERTSSGWTQRARLRASDAVETQWFGDAVALSGDRALIGAPTHWQTIHSDKDPGSAYLFLRMPMSSPPYYRWVQEAKLIPSDSADGDHFGNAVVLVGDLAFVGAEFDNEGRGAVYVFQRNSNTWAQQAKLTASDAVTSTNFGSSLSLSGDRILIGAINDLNHGAVYVFNHMQTDWVQEAKLTVDTTSHVRFGSSVSLDGDHALIGTMNNRFYNGPNLYRPGSAYLFLRTADGWREDVNLRASDGKDGDNFGCAVALEGNQALVGARRDQEQYYESGTAFFMQIAASNGTSCAVGLPCASGYCVNDVCCNTACRSNRMLCQRCSVATGASADGICTSLPRAACMTSAPAMRQEMQIKKKFMPTEPFPKKLILPVK